MVTAKIIKTAILGIVVGLLAGIQGQAGSLYILFGLMMLNIVDDQKMAAGTALLYTSVPVTIGAAYEYYENKNVDLVAAGILIPIVFIAAYLGAHFNPMIPEKYILYSIGITSLIITIYYFHQGYITKLKNKK